MIARPISESGGFASIIMVAKVRSLTIRRPPFLPHTAEDHGLPCFRAMAKGVLLGRRSTVRPSRFHRQQTSVAEQHPVLLGRSQFATALTAAASNSSPRRSTTHTIRASLFASATTAAASAIASASRSSFFCAFT
jgi:hypothetical protein